MLSGAVLIVAIALELTAPRLRAGAPPPPPAPVARARKATAERARAGVRFMERHGWVTDDHAYSSRPSALGVARRLKDAIVRHEGVPADHMTWRVWQRADGWHWSLGLKPAARKAPDE